MYFLKLLTRGERGRIMVHGEYESLKAIHAVSPELAPEPYAYGSFESGRLKTHFLLTQFRPIGQQPPAPVAFTKLLADLHRRSQSPTGRFGFHTTISHVTLPQITDVWEESWAVLYQRQFAHMVELDEERNGILTSFQRLARFTIDKVIPRLLEPLQSHGRSIKPCLVHGDLWDENTSTDISTGAPFIFDACSFYAHNELDLGNWRSLRHRLSRREYVESYKHFFPPSEPVQEWDDRNRLYSLRYELTYMIIMPGRYAGQRQCIEDSMLFLCQKYFPDEVLTAGLKDATSPELAECMKHP
ncbi:Fructosamine/Ketosamine-3-kinase [Dendryphion nanum]|uniref:protein-ribulosamine 3-kinase n=1 Tax=Dendryphion nanum TaxID=256645 RepID=A0A9P9DDC9_9PLEO|nr:Fructosamine/Ketosamine-3-kinase [Dendryphion nanum]